jgi:ribosomal protein L20
MIGLVANLVAIIAALLLLIVPLPFNTATRFMFMTPQQQEKDRYYAYELREETRRIVRKLCAKRSLTASTCDGAESYARVLEQTVAVNVPANLQTARWLIAEAVARGFDRNATVSMINETKAGSYPVVGAYFARMIQNVNKELEEEKAKEKKKE